MIAEFVVISSVEGDPSASFVRRNFNYSMILGSFVRFLSRESSALSAPQSC